MYLEVTSRCNLQCAHCMGDYGPHGQDMPINVFEASVTLYRRWKSTTALVLGGGEPTLHSQFFTLIEHVLDLPCILVTNGTMLRRVRWLVQKTTGRKFRLYLSLDKYHKPPRQEIIQLFQENPHCFFNTAADAFVIAEGRGRNLPEAETQQICPAQFVNVFPDGRMTHCGCYDSPEIGHVFDPPKHKPSGCWQQRDWRPTGSSWNDYNRKQPVCNP